MPEVVRLRADVQRGVAFAQDEAGLPAGSQSTQRVPDVAGDQADVARVQAELVDDRTVRLRSRLMAPNRLVHAEATFEQVDDACLL